jgi:hypothetical protein
LKIKSEYDKGRGRWERPTEDEEYDDNNICDKVKSIIEESRPTCIEQAEND